MSALDNQIRETVNRLLDSLRGHLESDISSSQDELIQTARDASARIAAESAEAATAEARREAEEARAPLTARIEDLERELNQARCEAQAARDELESVKRELQSAQAELDATRDDVEATLRDIEASRRDIETSRRDADAVRLEVTRLTDVVHARDERSAQALRLPDAVRALDEAATFGDVLEILAVRGGREAGRAAVFLVKGERLRDWRTAGFGSASDGSRLDITLDESGPMAEAVRSGEAVAPRNGDTIPEFARADEAREAAAWPVSVGGSVVAVLYADSPIADKSDEPYWPAFLDVLARHAGRVLEGLTVRQAAGLMTGKGSRPSASVIQSSGSIQ